MAPAVAYATHPHVPKTNAINLLAIGDEAWTNRGWKDVKEWLEA